MPFASGSITFRRFQVMGKSPKSIDQLFVVLAPTLRHVVQTLRGDSSHHGHRR